MCVRVSYNSLHRHKVPVIREQLLKTSSGQWKSIASEHVALLMQPDISHVQQQAKGYVV